MSAVLNESYCNQFGIVQHTQSQFVNNSVSEQSMKRMTSKLLQRFSSNALQKLDMS